MINIPDSDVIVLVSTGYVLLESIQVIPYDSLGDYHFPKDTFAVYSNAKRYRKQIVKITPKGAKKLQRFAEP